MSSLRSNLKLKQKLAAHISLKRQKGVVIVVALFIVALVATMAYTMMARLSRDTYRTSLILRNAQAELYAQGSIEWAKDQLRNDWERQKANRVIDPVPIKSPKEAVNGYTISSVIYDMQARFNLNNMIDPKAHDDFKRLLQVVDPAITEEKASELIIAIYDWIKPPASQNEYSKYYLQLKTPYRSAGKFMFSVSELQLVKGMTPALYQALKPYIIALPVQTPINVQTAPAPVLVALSKEMSLQTANAILKIREHTPFVSPQIFLNLDVIKNHPVPAEKITTASGYFLVETEIAIDAQRLVLYTLLERALNQSKPHVSILWQSKGIW